MRRMRLVVWIAGGVAGVALLSTAAAASLLDRPAPPACALEGTCGAASVAAKGVMPSGTVQSGATAAAPMNPPGGGAAPQPAPVALSILVPDCGLGLGGLCAVPGHPGAFAEAGTVWDPSVQRAQAVPAMPPAYHRYLCRVEGAKC